MRTARATITATILLALTAGCAGHSDDGGPPSRGDPEIVADLPDPVDGIGASPGAPRTSGAPSPSAGGNATPSSPEPGGRSVPAPGPGGANDPGSGRSTGGDDGPNGGGAPLHRNSTAPAPTSPLRIPSIIVAQGQPVQDIRARLEADLRAQCGDGTLCVTVTQEPGESEIFTRCQFLRTEPPDGAEVPRGGRVLVQTGPLPCPTPTP